MSRARRIPTGAGGRGVPYRRGAVMGLTMAEAFLLVSFALLLLLGLWTQERGEEEERLAPLRDLTPSEVEAARSLAAARQLEPLARLAEREGMAALTEAAPAGEVWRLVDREAEARLLDGVEALPPALKGEIADLMEIADPAALERALAAAAAALALPPGEAAEPLAGIGARLAVARAQRAALVADLQGTLGATVAAVGGTIEADGSIVLPDTVLFEQGRARITPVMLDFLDRACAPWLGVLRDAAAPVARAQVEGHASSEWRAGTGPDEAYMNNLALSQARAQAVLAACLSGVEDASLRAWAQGHLAAVGYSSARPVLVDGVEDPAASRRVVFSVGLDDGRLLREVEGEVAAGLEGR